MNAFEPNVAPNEAGILRLFALDTGTPAAASLVAALRDQRGDAGALVAQALGVADVDPYWIALIETSDLGALGLEGYLAEGHDVPLEALREARPALDAAAGTVIAVPSRAFGGIAQELRPAPWLTPVATFDTGRDPAPLAPMAPADVAPAPEPPRPAAAPPRPGATGLGGLSPRTMLMILAAAAIVVALVALGH